MLRFSRGEEWGGEVGPRRKSRMTFDFSALLTFDHLWKMAAALLAFGIFVWKFGNWFGRTVAGVEQTNAGMSELNSTVHELKDDVHEFVRTNDAAHHELNSEIKNLGEADRELGAHVKSLGRRVGSLESQRGRKEK